LLHGVVARVTFPYERRAHGGDEMVIDILDVSGGRFALPQTRHAAKSRRM